MRPWLWAEAFRALSQLQQATRSMAWIRVQGSEGPLLPAWSEVPPSHALHCLHTACTRAAVLNMLWDLQEGWTLLQRATKVCLHSTVACTDLCVLRAQQ